MSFSKFEADESAALDGVEAERQNWIQTMSIATTDSSQAAADAYVAKYPGLQEFSRRYADIHGYIAAVVCIFGVIANLGNIVVLTRRKMISPTNLILTWLAVADLLTMAIFLPFDLHFYVLRDRRLPFPSTRSVGWIRFSSLFCAVHTVKLTRSTSPSNTESLTGTRRTAFSSWTFPGILKLASFSSFSLTFVWFS